MIGTVVGGSYQILRRIGAGGMGTVFEGEHRGTGRKVAIKVLSKNLDTDDVSMSDVSETVQSNMADVIARFEREARAAARIDSEHVVQILDAGRDEVTGRPYMVMELLRGENLQQVVKRKGALPVDTVLRIAAQAGRGLADAHEAGIVHRDIKPGNLLLAERSDGRLVLKVLDFGIARVRMDQLQRTHEGQLTRTGSMLGSPQYMSPEQALGLKTIDHRADLWSLGVVLYRCLSGEAPFRGETLGQLIMSICTGEPRPLQDVAPWVPPAVAQLVHRNLQADPDQRFDSAKELADAALAELGGHAELNSDMIRPIEEAERAIRSPRVAIEPSAARAPEPPAGPDALGSAHADRAMRPGGESETPLEFRVTSPATARRPSGPRRAVLLIGLLAASVGGGAAASHYWVQQGASTSPAEPPTDAGPTGEGGEATSTEALGPSAQTTSSNAASRSETTVALQVGPRGVTVSVDGVDAPVNDGSVTIRGTLGSVHEVTLTLGKRSQTEQVAITEQGTSPESLTLGRVATKRPPSTARPTSTSASTPAPQPGPTSPTPTKPTPPRTSGVGVAESFE